MPCIPVPDGFLCVGNEPVAVGGYRFEWTAVGWIPVNKNGSERLSPVPNWVWRLVEKLPKPIGYEKAAKDDLPDGPIEELPERKMQ